MALLRRRLPPREGWLGRGLCFRRRPWYGLRFGSGGDNVDVTVWMRQPHRNARVGRNWSLKLPGAPRVHSNEPPTDEQVASLAALVVAQQGVADARLRHEV